MINTTNPLAARLRCSPMPIPVEYKDRASALTSKYVRNNSLSGEYRMDSGIVYNRICHMIIRQITDNPEFNVKSFPRFINSDTLFYSPKDIQTLALSYKENPNAVFPYLPCFFGRKLCSFKRHKIAYINGLDEQDVDQVMMIALYKVLDRYDPQKSFSFSYLELELFSAITQLGGEMHTFGMPRNAYVNYLKFSYFIEKYNLTPDTITDFLHEINAPEDYDRQSSMFSIDASDRRYSCRFSRRKALEFYNLYALEHHGIIRDSYYDEEADMMVDNTGGVHESGFDEAEMKLFVSQNYTGKRDARVFHRLTEPEGAVFSNRELKEDFQCTRYDLTKLKKQIKKDYFG